MSRRRWIALFLSLLLILGLVAGGNCGLVQSVEATPLCGKNTCILDPSRMQVYQDSRLDLLMTSYQVNPENAKKLYHGKAVSLVGDIYYVDSGGTGFSLIDGNNPKISHLSCTFSNNFPEELKQLLIQGHMVRVYGHVEINLRGITNGFQANSIRLVVDWVEEESTSLVLQDRMFLLDGVSILSRNDRNYHKESLETENNGKFWEFLVPEAWEEVKVELPNVEGYAYSLNQLSNDAPMEKLFVFYVTENVVNPRNKANQTSDVRAAIVKNILGNPNLKMNRSPKLYDMIIDTKYWTKSLDGDYQEWGYFEGNYGDVNFQNHNICFLFLPPEDYRGSRCILYVYNEPQHLGEIQLMLGRMAATLP